MFRSQDLDYGAVGNPIDTDQEMVELAVEYLWQDIPDNSIFPASPDPVGLAEVMESFRAEIQEPSSIPIPSVSAEPEVYQGFDSFVAGNTELTHMLFDWSFRNRDYISPEEIKAINFRQSTLEWATERLGYGIEGKKKLLNVLFKWVEHNQRCKWWAYYSNPNYPSYPNPNPSPYIGSSSQVYGCGYAVNPYSINQQFVMGIPLYQLGQQNPYVPNNGNMTNPRFPAVNAESSLGMFPPAARRRRMALMRSNCHSEDGERLGTDVPQPAMGRRGKVQPQIPACQLMVDPDYQFLLQKVLMHSDIDIGKSACGRIVLPKREAEIHLPPLGNGVKITIEMEEVGTSRLWSMRYRYWLNNVKSRMYILENTVEYVRANGLRVGDLIVLYLDTKRRKYMIRYVKDRLATQNLSR